MAAPRLARFLLWLGLPSSLRVLARLSLEGRSLLVSRMGDGGWWTLPLVLVLLALAGLVATWAPVRRVLRIRPQDALRADG